jgi:tetratricopeptide (TPR) repeat protein
VLNREIEHVGNPLRFFVDLETTATKEKPTTNIYRPVRTLSYAVLHQLFGKRQPAWWHGLAILLHAGCAMLLLWLLLAAGFDRWPASAGALLFALHPVTVETTLFSKEHAVVVPGLWLAWDYFLRPERRRARVALVGVAAGVAVVIGFLVFRASLGGTMRQIEGPLGGSHLTAVYTMLAGLGWYGATLLFPYGPTFDARVTFHESLFEFPVLIGLLFLAALVYGAVRGTPRTRLACTWFLMALVPVSNVIVPLKIPTADRFLYLPLMGLAFLGAELVRRLRPVSARVMPILILLGLGVLTLKRIPDWHDDTSLINAGLRVHPKSRMLLWAEAAQSGKRALESLVAGDARAGLQWAEQAAQLYESYIENSHPAEQTQAWIEKGDLLYGVGDWLRSRGLWEKRRELFQGAMYAYVQARTRQKGGIGRVIEEEVVHTALRLVDLSVELADAGDRNVGVTIAIGLEAMGFLKQEHGFDDRRPRAQLRFIDSVVSRSKQPEQARAGFDWVLATLDELNREGGKGLRYLRAEALFYRAILKDREFFNRPDMELAYKTYVAAARENPGIRVQALVHAGRAAGKIGQLFRDREWLTRGVAILQSIRDIADRDRLQVTDRQQREIESLLREFRGS